MRFLFKRPRMEDVSEELVTIMDVMASKIFIMMDLFWISLIFTLFLTPVLASVKLSILFFSCCFVLFNLLYFGFFYDPSVKKD